MASILLVSSGVFHPPLPGRLSLHRALRAAGGHHWQSAASLEALPRLDLSRLAAVVLCFHHARISPEALAAFEQYVSAGGRVLAIHAVTASFKPETRFFDVLGGRFTGHGPVGRFTVSPAPEALPALAEVGPFTVTDELYRHERRGDLRVHYSAPLDGEPVPVVWTHSFGQGCVCYAGLGHTSSTLRHPAYQRLLAAALTWLVNGAAPA